VDEGEQTTSSADRTPAAGEEREAALDPHVHLIPWERRGQLGALRAYWRTVFHVISRKGRLDDYMGAPVCINSAKRFRNITTWHALLAGFVAGLLVIIPSEAGEGTARLGVRVDPVASLVPLLGIAIGLACALLILYATTEAVAWFFCPRDFDTERQDRAIALSYYTCAPLALTVVAPLVGGILLLTAPARYMAAVLAGLGGVYLLDTFAWYRVVLGAVHSVTGWRAKRTAFAAIALPLLWVGLPILMGLVPAAIAVWVLMIASLS